MTSILLLFTFTIFWGASLLFVVQPIFGRFLLPLLGGAPAVWNACVLFFQATLLAGYAYAHALSTRLTLKRQVIGHGLLMLVVLVSLPIAIPAGWTPPVDYQPRRMVAGDRRGGGGVALLCRFGDQPVVAALVVPYSSSVRPRSVFLVRRQ